jgi:hypothetical protein
MNERMQRTPTHRNHELNGNELNIGFETFGFRGGRE